MRGMVGEGVITEARSVTDPGELLALGRSGKSWEFLAQARQNLRDDAVGFLVAANLARLGLRTFAEGEVQRLSAEARGKPDAAALARAIQGLAPDRVSPEELRATFHANTSAGWVDPRLIPALESALNRFEVFRASDGTRLARENGAPGLDALATSPEAARRAVQSIAALRDPKPPGVVLEGALPTWALDEILRATPGDALGYRARVFIVEPDPDAAALAIAMSDARGAIADARLTWCLGPECGRELALALAARVNAKPAWVHVRSTPTRGGPVTGVAGVKDVSGVLTAALRDHAAEESRLLARVRTLYAGRDPAWWRSRYASGTPLRVLIPTCRYSTFVRHSSEGLAGALRRSGCVVEVMQEDDHTCQPSAAGYLRAVERLAPDLIVMINYTRAHLGWALPQNVPCVCWVQDAMPDLFDAKIGSSQGPLDFLMGHLFHELFDRHAYPLERVLPVPVVADGERFHVRPVDAALRARFECELAMVTHHSETPHAMRDRLMREANRPDLEGVFRAIFDALPSVAREMHARPLTRVMNDMMDEVVGENAEVAASLLRHYAYPLLDRSLRHETLNWAARLTQRRGWRLHLYGRGWEQHPTLAAHAKGELTHGEELRAAYQSAGAHLHASPHTVLHQRVFECALSGGICLSRWHREMLSVSRSRLHAGLLRRESDGVDERGLLRYPIADDADACSYTALTQRLGESEERPWIPVHPAKRHVLRTRAALLGPDSDPAWVLGDLAQVVFRAEDEFESICVRAVENKGWRKGMSALIAGRVRATLTHDALAARLLTMVRESLARASHGEVAA